MDAILAIISMITQLPSSVFMAIVFTIMGVASGLKLDKAFRAGLLYGIGLWGLMTILNFFGSMLIPAVTGMAANWGIQKPIVDTPLVWVAIFGTIWPSLAIPIALGANFLLLLIGFTRTFNIDIFNLQFYYFVAAYAFTISGQNWIWSIATFLIVEIVILKIADYTAPAIQKHFDMPANVSFTQLASACCAAFGSVLGKPFQSIPFLKDLKADPKTLRQKFGIFGDPMIIGLVVALIVSLLGLWPDWVKILETSMVVAACLYIMPKMVAILTDGLIPISNAVRDRVSKSERFKGIYIGLDSYITAGYEDVLTAATLLIIFSEIACALIPTIQAIPITGLPFYIGDVNFILPFVGGNILLASIIGLIWEIIGAHFATWVAPVYTAGMAALGVEVAAGALYTWVVCPGWHILVWLNSVLWQIIGAGLF